MQIFFAELQPNWRVEPKKHRKKWDTRRNRRTNFHLARFLASKLNVINLRHIDIAVPLVINVRIQWVWDTVYESGWFWLPLTEISREERGKLFTTNIKNSLSSSASQSSRVRRPIGVPDRSVAISNLRIRVQFMLSNLSSSFGITFSW